MFVSHFITAFVIARAVVDGLLMQTLTPLCESFVVFLILLIVLSALSIALGRGRRWRRAIVMYDGPS
jgi:hypothetical protein